MRRLGKPPLAVHLGATAAMDVIPRPHSFAPQSGEFHLARGTEIACSEETRSLAELLRDQLERQLGVRLTVRETNSEAPAKTPAESPAIHLGLDSQVRGAEAYELEVTPGHVRLRASHPAGLFYGCQTLAHALTTGGGRLTAGRLSDAPRFRWRGAHLDVGRHFFPVEFIKRFIDLLALHKLNVFHWHLTEDQGWRIAIEAFPRLTEVAAWRQAAGEARYGGFYTQAEVREVVAHAASRFVEVVPEIEMPGHALAALAAYPELSCTGGPFEVETRWGIFDDVYCAGSDETLAFLERVLDEVVELFPSKFFHIGGDECPKLRWQSCPRCQARMQREGLKDEEELQSWFVRHMARYLESKGRRLVGWDEILEGGLAPGAAVMSWRGIEGGVRAAKLGHEVIMSPLTACYLDFRQADGEHEPGATYAAALPLSAVYNYEPIPAELDAREAALILGVQANVWTEWMSTADQVEYMTFPRLCALSEVAWSGPERDLGDFERRLELHYSVLDRWQVAYRGGERDAPSGTRPSSPGLGIEPQAVRA